MEEDKIKSMTRLLLSGAKMLDKHCGKCGSPLFEKNNKIICPVCGELEKGEENILKEKRKELLSLLEKEKDLKKIIKILEAIEKIDRILT